MSDRAIKEAITDFEIEVLNKEDEKLKILNLQILLINVL